MTRHPLYWPLWVVAHVLLLFETGCAHLEPGQPHETDTVCAPVGLHQVRLREGVEEGFLSCAQARRLVEMAGAELETPWTFIFTPSWPGFTERGQLAEGMTWPSRHVVEVRVQSLQWLPHECGHARDVELGRDNTRD